MDIKIKTQTGISIIDCTRKNIGLYGKNVKVLNYVVASQGDKVEVLGEYETEEDAQKVLDVILETIDNAYRKELSGIIIFMPSVIMEEEKNEGKQRENR